MGTSYTWGMGKGEAGKLAKNTFLAWGQKNIHSMSFRSITNGVMNILVQRKYPDKDLCFDFQHFPSEDHI